MSIRGLEDVVSLPVPPTKKERAVDLAASSSKGAPKGRNASGRSWKRKDQPRASIFMRNDGTGLGGSGLAVSWAERQSRKRKREEVKQLEGEMKEEKRQSKVEARKRREERAAMRAANEIKGTTMQALTKTHKFKTMNKKQLRLIKRTSVNAQTGQLELVSPWKK